MKAKIECKYCLHLASQPFDRPEFCMPCFSAWNDGIIKGLRMAREAVWGNEMGCTSCCDRQKKYDLASIDRLIEEAGNGSSDSSSPEVRKGGGIDQDD